MREWCMPKRFQCDDGALLEVYRIRAAGSVKGVSLEDGAYVVVHLEDDHFKVRTLVGPFSDEKALTMLDNASVDKLLDLLISMEKLKQRAVAEGGSGGETVH